MKLPGMGQDPETLSGDQLPKRDFWRFYYMVIGETGRRREVLSPALPLLKRNLCGEITLDALRWIALQATDQNG